MVHREYNFILNFKRQSVKTAVITTGGLGTRLLTYTKSNPKTMLPLYEKSRDTYGEPVLRPLIEIIFENLYDRGFRRFCFIIGKKTQKPIKDHLTPDSAYIKLLRERNKIEDRRFIKTLTRIYGKINNCQVMWITQSTPMGFGHALLSAQKFVGNDTFLLHAGDAYFPNYDFLIKSIKKFGSNDNADGLLLLQHKKQVHGYGLAKVKNNCVIDVQEKPKKPTSNLVILPVYVFKPSIFNALRNTDKGHNCELQVTDAVKTLIKWDRKVISVNFGNKPWFDIGSPENYFRSLSYSYDKAF